MRLYDRSAFYGMTLVGPEKAKQPVWLVLMSHYTSNIRITHAVF